MSLRKKIIILIMTLAALVIIATAAINRHVLRVGGELLHATGPEQVSEDLPELDDGAPGDAGKESYYQCIIVLGASVHDDGTPSLMLKDRLDKAYELYQTGAAPKILVSGDNGQVEYNEVEVMKNYLLDKGVPAEDIFMDHAGFSTYETMFRAQAVFSVDRAVIVTQKYHEYRALYIAKRLGLDVWGTPAAEIGYSGQGFRDFREVLARVKDFFMCIFKPDPKYLGDPFDITGDGQLTWN